MAENTANRAVAVRAPSAPTPPAVARFESLSVADLIKQANSNPLKWIVRDVLVEDGVHVLHGPEETYKTMLTMQLHAALTNGGKFLLRDVEGGFRTGVVELEMKNRQFGQRLANQFPNAVPDIRVLPDSLRRHILACNKPKDRIGLIVEWSNRERLQVVSIDSVVKLFPPGCDVNNPAIASEVFSQLQLLPTVWIIAHDRKPQPGIAGKAENRVGNAEIVGSGRFAQDPDVIHQIVRDDKRAPVCDFHWGKMRCGEKHDPIRLYFDCVDYRLYPLHPYLHLLERRPMLGAEMLAEAESRYRWKERRARNYLAELGKLRDGQGNPCVAERQEGHSKRYELTTPAFVLSADTDLDSPGELVQGCSKPMGQSASGPHGAVTNSWGGLDELLRDVPTIARW